MTAPDTIPAADRRHTLDVLLTAAADMYSQYNFVRITSGGTTWTTAPFRLAQTSIFAAVEACRSLADLEAINVGPSQADTEALETQADD